MVRRRGRRRRVFAPSEVERRRLVSDFEAFHGLPLGEADLDLACRLGFDTRRRGHTVPAIDLIIAASALRSGAPLLHVDAHFDRIAEVSDLVVIERSTES